MRAEYAAMLERLNRARNSRWRKIVQQQTLGARGAWLYGKKVRASNERPNLRLVVPQEETRIGRIVPRSKLSRLISKPNNRRKE